MRHIKFNGIPVIPVIPVITPSWPFPHGSRSCRFLRSGHCHYDLCPFLCLMTVRVVFFSFESRSIRSFTGADRGRHYLHLLSAPRGAMRQECVSLARVGMRSADGKAGNHAADSASTSLFNGASIRNPQSSASCYMTCPLRYGSPRQPSSVAHMTRDIHSNFLLHPGMLAGGTRKKRGARRRGPGEAAKGLSM